MSPTSSGSSASSHRPSGTPSSGSHASECLVTILLPSGTERQYPNHCLLIDIAEEIGDELVPEIVAVEVNGALYDVTRPLGEIAQGNGNAGLSVKFITRKDAAANSVLYKSAANVVARAVMILYENVSLSFGPTTEDGFYYDFEFDAPLGQDSIPTIEAEIVSVLEKKEAFERFVLSRAEGRRLCVDLGQKLKVSHIDEVLKESDEIVFYRQGEFVDLCHGPHLPDTGRIDSVKLTGISDSPSGREDAERPLQRIYGTASFA